MKPFVTFQSLNLKETLVFCLFLMFVKVFISGTFASSKGDVCTSFHLLSDKHINIFRMCGGQYSCRNVIYIYIGSSLFTEVISTNMLIGKDFFVFRNAVQCKRIIFTFSSFFLKSKKTFSLLCFNPLMTSIQYHILGINS